MSEIFDLIIIGAGPGGYHAAIRASQYGAKVAIVEKNEMGGTCLNVGCIPTKALYASTKLAENIKEKAEDFGIKTGEISLDFGQAVDRKNKVVDELIQGIYGLLNNWKVQIFKGFGSLSGGDAESGYEVTVSGAKMNVIKGKKIILATGARPALVPEFNIDHERILTSDDILSTDFKIVPKSLVIIGGGYIGCEMANIFANFGSKVSIIEFLPTILATEEALVVKELRSKFKRIGIDIFENVNSLNIENTGSGVNITTCSSKIPKNQINSAECTYYDAEYCLISIGRTKNSENLGLEKFGIEVDRGSIKVDPITLETSAKGIYGIGDAILGLMLAHVASYEGNVAVCNALYSIGGFEVEPKEADYSVIPYTIFTNPEIGSVGLKSQWIKRVKIKTNIGRFSYTSLGKAKCIGEEDGFIMIYAEKKTDKILGATCVGSGAPELIASISLAMKNGLTTLEIADTVYSHPTISEMVLECAEDIHGMAIHKVGRKK